MLLCIGLPFSRNSTTAADRMGLTDSTVAIQWAIEYAYDNYLVAYFPVGRYKVTDTINATQRNRLDAGGTRFLVHHFRGEVGPNGERPTLFLPAQCEGFTNGSTTKYLVHFWHLDQASGNLPGKTQPNIDMNQVWQGIDVDLGAGGYLIARQNPPCALLSG